MNTNKNNTFKLGRSIANIVPFYRTIIEQIERPIIITKLVIVTLLVAIAKIAVLIML
jgi:hypothetical protein